MSIVFVLRCDGRRDYIDQAVASAIDNLKAHFDRMVIVNDSGDHEHASWLEQEFPAFEFVHHAERLGMNTCVRTAFQVAIATGADAMFSTEDDFRFNESVNVKKMYRLLHCEPHLAALTLKRNPWNDQEIAAGGQIETAPDEYFDRSCVTGNWVEHDHLFSGNPSLVRVDAIKAAVNVDMPDSDTYERPAGLAMIAAGYRFAFYGKRDDKPRCEHLGHSRSSGYRW